MTSHADDDAMLPDGPSSVRVLGAATVRTARVGPMDNNTYLVTCHRTGAQLLIDAAADPERLLALVREGSGSARLDLVITTHGHADHHGALESILAVTGAHNAAGVEDCPDLPVVVDRPLRHGDTVAVGDLTFDVVGLRGHTPGSVALVYRDTGGTTHLFSGDSLFPGGVGRTWEDPARFAQLLADVSERVFDVLPDDTVVHPGHGSSTTLGVERPQLPTWRARGW